MNLQHLAIIPDGNRRWARERGLPTFEGHRKGIDAFREIVRACFDRGVQYVTLWGFSTENWKRTEEEVGYLMDLFLKLLTKDVKELHEEGVRVRVIGRREELSKKLVKAIDEAETLTQNNTKGQVNLCINYGGRPEIVAAVKEALRQGIDPDDMTDELFTSLTWFGSDVPKPDMIVRTSGEQRLSGFLSWSGGYSELMFIEKYLPDFGEQDIDAAIAEFELRQRRFGK